ncbi:helicase C-terminal domain-containing protein [Paenibacillus sp. L3-i20]|uniref:helicase C-terminal domain-containing protein n=1 Tax=Paenibacillus sp. L3-i20 TaxID=2905833 RepID=UPI001EE056D7|nr:helicase C-terminal domain-containing protein [Paenibacillus sp. L3-i20]GKU77656.1 ATP-dependent helicase [Paenibacillus sp. L3-i20]
MTDTYTVNLSVRHLVEYVYRSGSIDARLQSVDAMHEGTKAHLRVQGNYGDGDQREVYLKADIAWGDLLFALDGRCDGLLATEPVPTIDEIKSSRGDLVRIKEEQGYAVHWAQAWFYAYMYAKQTGTEAMRVQLTYVQTGTGEEIRFVREASFEELECDVLEMVARYAPYAQLRKNHQEQRDVSIAELPFPFESYRAGQRKLAGAVYKTIDEGVSLFARAPTGIGKTVSTTYPAIKAIGSGVLQRIYYLTARTTTRAAAEDALILMKSQGLRIHAVTITAKDKICFQEETRCERESCSFADGYYDRINGAVLDIFEHETIMTRAVIEQYARKHSVCPFEFSLDLSYGADIVICDYNYVFDPRISFKRQYAEGKKRTALLIDEAHNLVDRAREMYSGELMKAPFLSMQRELKGRHKSAYLAAKAVNDNFIAQRKLLGESTQSVDHNLPEELVALVEAFAAEVEKLLESGVVLGGITETNASEIVLQTGDLFAQTEGTVGHIPDTPEVNQKRVNSSQLLDIYYGAQQFLRAAKVYDERFVTLTELTRKDMRVKLQCLDPSSLLGQMGKGYRSHIYFSATLTPLRYYMDMLGGREQDYTLSLPSPFSRDQLKVAIHPLSTRFADRGDSYVPIAELIQQSVQARRGNYFVFFPSYAYMNAVHEAYIELLGKLAGESSDEDVQVLLQRTDMSEAERDEFLSAFQPDNKRTLIGFAVMGGIFSEGVDLPGDRLIGVVIVGVGLPQLGIERNTLRDYYQKQGHNGFDYAYVIPGMNKVLQAGGRLIRSEKDSGTLLLIDDRYLQGAYLRLLPEEWLPLVENDLN